MQAAVESGERVFWEQQMGVLHKKCREAWAKRHARPEPAVAPAR